jgi:hypothetical protein
MSGTEMQQILAMLQKMGEKQEKLAAQVSAGAFILLFTSHRATAVHTHEP